MDIHITHHPKDKQLCNVRSNCQGVTCSICNHHMIFEHYKNHLATCKSNNSNYYKFGAINGLDISSILNVSVESLAAISDNEVKINKSIDYHISSQSKEISFQSASSGELFKGPSIKWFPPKIQPNKKTTKKN